MGGLPRLIAITCLAALPFLAAPAAAGDTAVVPVRVIYPGETVFAEALDEVVVRRPQNRNAAIARRMEDLDGKVARRTLLPGRLVPLSSVREPYLVERGSAVTAVFTDGPLTISLTAVPLQSGAAGDLVRLRNIDSGAVITGIVMRDGTVRVGGS